MVSIMFFLGCLVSVEIYGEWHSEKRALGETSMQECHIHCESKKRHETLGHNFTNYYPIFKILSLADSVVNLQQIHV